MSSTNVTNVTNSFTSSSGNMTDLQGHIISRSFRPGFVVLSYFVSYVGAWTTLELLHRRTSMKGVYNWFLLVSSSITMGGIAVWSMHFIGNRAIVLGDGDPAIQILYSSNFTLISFFVPVAVVFLAFATVGTANHTLSLTRLTLGGTIAGFGICGMHYLGQAGISNYDCTYNRFCVVGAAVIAILASVGALITFFVHRSSWRTTWWKRACCALILAGAVSGMHWVATVGTMYRLRVADPGMAATMSRSLTVVIVLILSIVACFILLFFMFIAQRRIIMLAKRAQQVVLAVAVFDSDGRILVSAEGMLPTRKITNSWLEQSLNDVFNVSHPVFLWMFRTSRNWLGISHLLPAMKSHIHQIGLKSRLGSKDEQLLNETGTPIENYTLVFRELFCIAAADLAASMHQPIEKVGVLYDEMISTGNGADEQDNKGKRTIGRSRKSVETTNSGEDVELEAYGVSGKGQLLFLVSRVGRLEAESFQAAGYRFAHISQVISIVANSLQVKPGPLTRRFEIMQEYVKEPHILDPGVHLSLFAIRASLGAGRHGFDLLARKDAKNQLPTMQLSAEPLEDWQWDYIRGMDTFPLAVCTKAINKSAKASNPSKKEQAFAKLLLTALEALKAEIEDPFVNDALLIGRPIDAPCRPDRPDSAPSTAQLICFTIIVPIHGRAPGKKLVFEPLTFFTMQQHVYPKSPDHEAFARKTYQEYKSVLNLGEGGAVAEGGSFSGFYSMSPYNSGFPRPRSSRMPVSIDNTSDSPSRKTKIKFWDRTSPSSPSEVKAAAIANANGDMFSPQTSDISGTAGLLVPHSEAKDRLWDRNSPISLLNTKSAAIVTTSDMLSSQTQANSNNGLVVPKTGANPKEVDPKETAEEEEKEQKTYVDELFLLTIQKKGAVR